MSKLTFQPKKTRKSSEWGWGVCSWWVGLVFTNNLFREECLQAAVDNAVNALSGGLLDAGVDGVL